MTTLPKILIPVAAFAITATGVSAFNGNWANLDLGLSDSQVTALEKADDIRTAANEEARQVLTDAGIDDTTMRKIHEAMHTRDKAEHEAIQTAIDNNDYSAFTTAVANTPLADKITSQEAFDKFVEAHALMESGDYEGARTIMDELGIGGPGMMGEGFGEGPRDGHMKGGHGMWDTEDDGQ